MGMKKHNSFVAFAVSNENIPNEPVPERITDNNPEWGGRQLAIQLLKHSEIRFNIQLFLFNWIEHCLAQKFGASPFLHVSRYHPLLCKAVFGIIKPSNGAVQFEQFGVVELSESPWVRYLHSSNLIPSETRVQRSLHAVDPVMFEASVVICRKYRRVTGNTMSCSRRAT